MTAAERVGVAAQIACLLEVSAPKPGNVQPGAPFADARYEGFLLSAAAIGPAMAAAGDARVGATILRAARDTRRVVRTNTNLGIVLLLAPLAKAAATVDADAAAEGPSRRAALRDAVRRVLDALDVEDAREAYAAIRLAEPGGLGSIEEQDVAGEPTVTLREAMALAADRDGVAREYVTDYAVTFEQTVPALERGRRAGLVWPDAIVQAYLELLAEVPDTLIARKRGRDVADEVSRDARRALEAGGMHTDVGRREVAALERAWRDDANTKNPGTTADLVAAGLFVLWWSERGSYEP